MRPTARPQSALRTPLNTVLGTEARVRVLRVLASADSPIAPGEIARRAALQPSGVRLIVAELVDGGIVEMVGSGKQRLAQLAAKHPLSKALIELFAAERARVERLTDGIRAAAISAFHAPVGHVWIEGPFATGTDRPGESVTVGALAHAPTIDSMSAALQAALTPVEEEHDVTIDIRSLTYADLAALTSAERAQLGNVIPLVGMPPLSVLEPKATGLRARSHADLDAQALALGRAIANKLKTDPTLVANARRALAARLRRASAGERRTLEEWDQILAGFSIPRLRKLLVDTGPRATRLRQSLPFLDALSPSERHAILQNPSNES